MDKQVWLDVKQHQIKLYRKRAAFHTRKRKTLTLICVISGILAAFMPFFMLVLNRPLIALGFLILIPVSILAWELSRQEIRPSQLLRQLAKAVARETKSNEPLDSLKKNVTVIETRFLSNDDELFVKKAIWGHYVKWNFGPEDSVFSNRINIGPVWNTDIPHRQGYRDSNTIEDEWAIIKALSNCRGSYDFRILNITSNLAQKNPVVFERFLRKKKISKELKSFKQMSRIHYLSAAAKMRLVTFVEEVLALEPTELNEATVTLLHEKNEQIKKYTEEFWNVHRRSLKFYLFEALWLLLLIPFIIAAITLLNADALIEAIIVFSIGAALVTFGEMALVVKQKIKLNGKKLMPPLISSLIGSRHAMCADTNNEKDIDNYRCRFKNLEKHFIMTTSEIDSVRYVMNNLRDEKLASKSHVAEEICRDAQRRLDTYYKMFHLYRHKGLQFVCVELFLIIMLVPAFVIGMMIMVYAVDFLGVIGGFVTFLPIIILFILGRFVQQKLIQVWRFKEMYFKIYQGLSVLIVDGDLRSDPEKLKNMFREIEQSALKAICTDPAMYPMLDTLSRVSGLKIPTNAKPHELDRDIKYIMSGGRRW